MPESDTPLPPPPAADAPEQSPPQKSRGQTAREVVREKARQIRKRRLGAARRQREWRRRKAKAKWVEDGKDPAEWERLNPAPPDDPDDDGDDAGDPTPDELADEELVEDAKKQKRTPAAAKQRAADRTREAGWLRDYKEVHGAAMASSKLRDVARLVFEREGLPFLQEVIADPKAKDSDKLRAVDLVAKVAVGYVTPDMIGGEDAPDLPPPIFETTSGDLPHDDAPTEDTGGGDAPGHVPVPTNAAPATPPPSHSAGTGLLPIPHIGAA